VCASSAIELGKIYRVFTPLLSGFGVFIGITLRLRSRPRGPPSSNFRYFYTP
jgi:hypothetical protein